MFIVEGRQVAISSASGASSRTGGFQLKVMQRMGAYCKQGQTRMMDPQIIIMIMMASLSRVHLTSPSAMQLFRKPFRAWHVVRMHGIFKPTARPMSMMFKMSCSRAQKEEGSISSLFASLNGEAPSEFPARYLDLKGKIWRDDMVHSWREVLAELESAAEEISSRGSEVHLSNAKKVLSDRIRSFLGYPIQVFKTVCRNNK
jgi:hypothetical protein